MYAAGCQSINGQLMWQKKNFDWASVLKHYTSTTRTSFCIFGDFCASICIKRIVERNCAAAPSCLCTHQLRRKNWLCSVYSIAFCFHLQSLLMCSLQFCLFARKSANSKHYTSGQPESIA